MFMEKNKIEILVEEVVDDLLAKKLVKKKSKRKKIDKLSYEYVYYLKRKDPALFELLAAQARFIIAAVENGYSPKDKIISLNKFLKMDKKLDPRDSADTHGVKLVLDYLVRQQKIKDPGEFAGKTKRWYQAALDAVLRATYEKKPIKVSKEQVTYNKKKLNESSAVHKSFYLDLPDDLLRVSDIFKSHGYQLFVVGGAVRDALIGKAPKDYDLATNAKPDEILQMFNGAPGFRTLEVGKAFGVINVYTKENNEYEIATFRRDLSAGRRPDAVEFTTIENDVQRRDLSINALFYDIQKQEIVDFVGGIEDLKNGIVKSVGDPKERFAEDRLRILRALRFAARMGTELDTNTRNAILEDNSLSGVSPERIRDEFLKSIKSAKSVVSLMKLYDTFDLWPQVFPNLRINKDYPETKNIPVLLALLLRENNPKNLGNSLNKLVYSVIETKQVVFLVMFQEISFTNAYQLKKLFSSTRLTNSDLLEFGKENKNIDMKLVNAFTKYDLSVSGQDLLDLGLKGRELGQELERRENSLFMDLV